MNSARSLLKSCKEFVLLVEFTVNCVLQVVVTLYECNYLLQQCRAGLTPCRFKRTAFLLME